MMVKNNTWIYIVMLTFLGCKSNYIKTFDLLEIHEKFNAGLVHNARIDIDKFIADNPNHGMAWTLKGNIENSEDNDSIAIIAYKKAILINPEIEEAFTGLGIIERKRGNFNKASEYYFQAIKINPNYGEAYTSLVVVNINLNKFDEAVEVGIKGYKLNKTDPVSAANLCIAYFYSNDSINTSKYFQIAKKNGYENLKYLEDIISDK